MTWVDMRRPERVQKKYKHVATSKFQSMSAAVQERELGGEVFKNLKYKNSI